MTRVLKSVTLGVDGADEMYGVFGGGGAENLVEAFARDRARFVMDTLPVHVESFSLPVNSEEDMLIVRKMRDFFGDKTRDLDFKSLYNTVTRTFGKFAREQLDHYLRLPMLNLVDYSDRVAKPHMKLYPSTPHGYWWLDEGMLEEIEVQVMALLRWSRERSPTDRVEFASLAEFAAAYPQFARRYDRSVSDNRDFPPARLFAEFNAVPYSRRAELPRNAGRFDTLRWMQLFSKDLVMSLGVPSGDTEKTRMLRMIACVVYFVNELSSLTKIQSTHELSRALFGVVDAWPADGDYPAPAYVGWIHTALARSTWDLPRKARFLRAEACFLSYCRDFALGNLFTRESLNSPAFRVDYIETALGGGFINSFFAKGEGDHMYDEDPSQIVFEEAWKHLKVDAAAREDHVSISEALMAYVLPASSSKPIVGDSTLNAALADLIRDLDASSLKPEQFNNKLRAYIEPVLVQLGGGSYMPLGWIRAHRINLLIMQRWKEHVYRPRQGIQTPEIADLIEDIIVRVNIQLPLHGRPTPPQPPKYMQVPHADVYYTLNAASITDYPHQVFGPTITRGDTLALLMLDPLTQGVMPGHQEREENRWLLCGGDSFKNKVRVCDLRNRLYMQPGSLLYGDSVRLATAIDVPVLSSLTKEETEKKIGAPKSLFDALAGLNNEKDPRGLQSALNHSAKKVVKGVDYELLQIFAALDKDDKLPSVGRGIVLDALYHLLVNPPNPRKQPANDDSEAADYEFTGTLDALYLSMVPFAAVSMDGLLDSRKKLELVEGQRDMLMKSASVEEFAASINYHPDRCRIAYAVRSRCSEPIEGLKVLYSALEITDTDMSTYLECIHLMHASLSKVKGVKKTNGILTDAAEFIARKRDIRRYDMLNLRMHIDAAARHVVAIPRELYALLRAVDPDFLAGIHLKPVSQIRPHERYYHALALSSKSLTDIDESGRIYCLADPSVPLYLVLNHPDIPLRRLESSSKLAPALLYEKATNGPSFVSDSVQDIECVEVHEVTLGLVNACIKSPFRESDTAEARLLDRIYAQTCLKHGFGLVERALEKEGGDAKRVRFEEGVVPDTRNPALLIELMEVHTVDEAIDRLIMGIEGRSHLKLQHARVSFVFAALPRPGEVTAKYAVMSPLDAAPQRVQSSHLLVIVCGRNVYLTSTHPSK
jgi:hypothetical protein